MRKKFLLYTILIFSIIPGLIAQEEIQIRTEVDWKNMIFQLDMTAPIEAETSQPTGRYKTEQFILRQTPVVSGEVLLPLVVDSWNTVGDLVSSDPVLLRKLESLSRVMKKIFTTATADRKFLTVRYELPLFPSMAELLIKHEKPYSYPLNPVYMPNSDFTGIVIYAGEALPWHGTNGETAELTPCLFPRFFDRHLNEIHSVELTDPAAISLWGNAGYTYSSNISQISSRVGVYPLRTMARAVYGKNRTDLILPDDAVKRISSSAHNRELLQQGRVVIILPEKVQPE